MLFIDTTIPHQLWYPRNMDTIQEQLSSIIIEQSRMHGTMKSLDSQIATLKETVAPQPEPQPIKKEITPPPLPKEKPIAKRSPKPEPKPKPVPIAQKPLPKPPAAESLEIRLGTVWFVRIGVLMLLTGLVFLSKFAYSNFINDLPAIAKVVGLYLLSFALTGAGMFLGREKGNPKLRTFGRVLAAGGLAAVYYTTYAAHYIERLQVIASPIFAGFLLLLSVLPILGYAAWRKSQTVAGIALALAFYTSIMSPVGWFSMFSSLLLAAAGVAFLVRFRWAAIGFASLIGTYGAFAFWQYLFPSHPEINSASLGFLIGYFVLFTATVFFPNRETLSLVHRTTFASFNNTAFLGLFTLGILQINQDGFWIFGVVSGIVLLGLAFAASRRFPTDGRYLIDAYLLKGLALFTLGIAAKLSGYQLALAFAAQATVLSAFYARRNNPIFLAASCLLASLALFQIYSANSPTFLTHTLISVAFVLAAWDLRRLKPDLAPMGKLSGSQLGFFPLLFSFLALVVWTMGLERTPHVTSALVATGFVFAMIGTTRRQLLPEIVFLSQAFTAIGGFFFAINRLASGFEPLQASDYFTTILLLALSVIWGWRGNQGRASGTLEAVFAGIFTLAISILVNIHIEEYSTIWLWLSGIVAIAIILLSIPLRNRPLTLFGYATQFLGFFAFLSQIAAKEAPTYTILFPVLLTLTTAIFHLPHLRKLLPALLTRGITYFGAVSTAIAFTIWCFGHFAAAAPLIIAVTSLPLLLHRRTFPFSIGFLTLAVGVFLFRCVPFTGSILSPRWIDLLIPAIALGSAQLLRRRKEFDPEAITPLAATLSLIGLFTVFLFFTSHVPSLSGHLTTTWSILALLIFGGGLALGDRPIRLTGLGLLALALGRILLFDIWNLPTEARFVSFFAIGGVLVALGFVYNRFQDTIRKFL